MDSASSFTQLRTHIVGKHVVNNHGAVSLEGFKDLRGSMRIRIHCVQHRNISRCHTTILPFNVFTSLQKVHTL